MVLWECELNGDFEGVMSLVLQELARVENDI